MLVHTSELSAASTLFSVYSSLKAERHVAVIVGKSAIHNADLSGYLEAKSDFRKFNDIINDHFIEADDMKEEFPGYSNEQYRADSEEKFNGIYVDDSVDVPF